MVIEESGLKFRFAGNVRAKKYDESNFYCNYMKQLPEAKGVDILSIQNGRLILTEIKNCSGHEADNNWRIYPNNRKVSTAHTTVNTEKRESLDIEVAKKIAMTINGLVGAYTKISGCTAAEELYEYAEIMISDSIRSGKSQLLIILFLEGAFGCESRRKTTIMSELQKSIKKKLSWLNCLVSVVDSDTYNRKIFQVE